MITVADAELLERETELHTLRAQLDSARHGCGTITLVEAPAGQGKTTLLRAVRTEASAAGLRTLSAIGADLERDFAFGIIRQLLPGLEATPADTDHARLHALYEHIADLAAEQPLLIVVDDVHWADAGSLKTLGMLARRIEHLPIALVAGLRPDQHEPLLDALFAAPAATVLHPAPLSPDAVAHLIETALDGELEPEFAAAAARSTGGNPLLVRELRRTLADGRFTGAASEAEAVRRAVPGSVARLVQSRLRPLSPDALALARAVAVVCPRTDSAITYALAGLSEPTAAEAHAAARARGPAGARPAALHPRDVARGGLREHRARRPFGPASPRRAADAGGRRRREQDRRAAAGRRAGKRRARGRRAGADRTGGAGER